MSVCFFIILIIDYKYYKIYFIETHETDIFTLFVIYYAFGKQLVPQVEFRDGILAQNQHGVFVERHTDFSRFGTRLEYL